MPIACLQLDPRTETFLLRNGIATIDDFLGAIVGEAVPWAALGPRTNGEIEGAIDRLAGVMDATGRIDWPAYVDRLPRPPANAAFTSMHLESLSEGVRALSMGCLHIRKAFNPLERDGVETIGDLVDRVRAGRCNLKGFGRTSKKEVWESISALSDSTTEGGGVDWVGYAALRGFTVIPSRPPSKWTARNLVANLPRYCEIAIGRQTNPQGQVIFQQRLLVDPETRPKLEEVGRLCGRTRERIRQRQDRMADWLRRALLFEDYRGLCFRFRPEIGAPLRLAAAHFKAFGRDIWLKGRWVEELARFWGVDPAAIWDLHPLYLEILGQHDLLQAGKGLGQFVSLAALSRNQIEWLERAMAGLPAGSGSEPLEARLSAFLEFVNTKMPRSNSNSHPKTKKPRWVRPPRPSPRAGMQRIRRQPKVAA